ncbi:MMPL family transporter [Telluria mixta]|uniref:MMPL family transporter n=1 Tax=Telluria mixta TaxID=34071 RepID=A0ABT2C125_9BURK|nr:MMPL family transporter [Telluria mixta]MCS0630379.1 MMPL family transporter [Telluria mixta]WEM94317.1 MMPL family transporter [Telluria mixta]
MLTHQIARLVHLSCRHPWAVVGAFVLLVLASGLYVARHFAINTDVGQLIDANAPWARRDAAIAAAFPNRGDTTLAVVRAPAPEFAAQAARELADRLRRQPALFRAVDLGAGDDFFCRNGLLYLDAAEVRDLTARLVDARPLLDALARDPSLRGIANLLSVTLGAPLLTGQVTLPQMAPLLARSAATVEDVLAGRNAALSWQALATTGAATEPGLVEVRPVLDYAALLPGAASSDAIRAAAADLRLAEHYGAQVTLTGPVPLSDDEFASLQEGSPLVGSIPVVIVLVLLWRAVRSAPLVLALCITMLGGLALTAALGLIMVGALNLISIAFAILFVGLGIDFGIQFGMRFRELRRVRPGTGTALLATARALALPLTLAATATAFGFLAFLPTAYRGVAELGQIAGVGILCVALPACLTVLPALIRISDPPAGLLAPGYPWLAGIDHALQTHRKTVLAATLALVGAGIPLLWRLEFDFDPLHLKNPGSESMATLASLARGTDIGLDNVQVLAPSLAQATTLAARLERLPDVAHVLTAASLVPDGQTGKLDAIAAAAARLLPVLEMSPIAPASDPQRAAALRTAALSLHNAALDHPGPGAAEASRLARALAALARAGPAARDRADQALAGTLRLALDALRLALQPQPVTLATLPAPMRRNWIAPDGRALVDVSPRRPTGPTGTSREDASRLRRFTDAVLRIAPDAAGGPISVRHAADLIIAAFVQAALLAVVTIALLLWIAFRRVGDVLLTMVPLLVSSLVTLEACVLLRIHLNFANIIALPLLLGVGVAFKIYYIMAWRAGQPARLEHPLTQAIVLSAATTGTAFGSLWLSHHPGTASMGKLLVLALVCTLIGAVFFQPVLLGQPRAPAPAERGPP